MKIIILIKEIIGKVKKLLRSNRCPNCKAKDSLKKITILGAGVDTIKISFCQNCWNRVKPSN